MSSVSVRNLRRAFGDVVAPDGWSHEVAGGHFFCRLGPLPAGGTTSPCAIAGREEIEAGNVLFDSMVPDFGRGLLRERLHTIKSGENDRSLTIENSGHDLPGLAATIRVGRDFAVSREVSSRDGYRRIREAGDAA